MKQKILCILIIILSICVVIFSLLSVFGVLMVPGLVTFMGALIMSGLVLINYPNYKNGLIKKQLWIPLFVICIIAAVLNLVVSILQLVQYFV